MKQNPTVPIEVSARHVHLTADDWRALFGGATITTDRHISQPGQFLAKERLVLRGPKNEYRNIGVVGPFRSYTQVELAASEARHLGIDAPLCDSGQLNKAAEITMIGPAGQLTASAAIIHQRHLHCHPDDAKKYGWRDGQIVSAIIPGPRGAQLNEVMVRISPEYAFRLHLDLDEGNACGVQPGMAATIIT